MHFPTLYRFVWPRVQDDFTQRILKITPIKNGCQRDTACGLVTGASWVHALHTSKKGRVLAAIHSFIVFPVSFILIVPLKKIKVISSFLGFTQSAYLLHCMPPFLSNCKWTRVAYFTTSAR